MKYRRIAATLAALALPGFAHAHVGLHADGALSGLGHPFSGLDHILAMVAVGFWASTLGGKARWIVPSAFVAVMAVGAIMGIHGLPFPMVEAGIALTVAVLGLLVAFEVKIPIPVAATVVGICALFHGHAHGTELPAIAHAGGYVAGFLVATIALNAIGICLASLRFGKAGQAAMRIAGWVVALAGAALLAG
ncbi:urease accessory protein [Sinorhizobium terangae]|uniref:Urease accessory protein n=1 Tax=Sinorhizobium terangae TaxID=110322 RepID=A0A6N7LJW3_SINTE|nr:HupE/UreJ family protein [Sinorhizobium terangae]MBB4188556.1 urease accessory protein [Sinorhizobium terangae]MQX18163.1 urease accessory protein [Sinorhizobium terangae]